MITRNKTFFAFLPSLASVFTVLLTSIGLGTKVGGSGRVSTCTERFYFLFEFAWLVRIFTLLPIQRTFVTH